MEIEERLRTLLLQGLDADTGAYQRFLKELSAHLRAFLRRRLAQRPDEVEDLVQETLLAVHNQRHTYRPDMPVTAWVHAIARYKLVDWPRSHAVKGALTARLPRRGATWGNCCRHYPTASACPSCTSSSKGSRWWRRRALRGCRNRQSKSVCTGASRPWPHASGERHENR